MDQSTGARHDGDDHGGGGGDDVGDGDVETEDPGWCDHVRDVGVRAVSSECSEEGLTAVLSSCRQAASSAVQSHSPRPHQTTPTTTSTATTTTTPAAVINNEYNCLHPQLSTSALEYQ